MQRMTDDGAGQLTAGERLFLTLVLGLVATLTLADVVADWSSGGSAPHLSAELLAAGVAVVGLGWLWARYFVLHRGLSTTRQSLAGARAEAARWRQHHAQLLQGLSGAIDQQLNAWSLTPAEREVAFLLLKGLSFKEMASVRGTSERTVRQQALAVYAKSGVAGRAELSAFFLEDLLVPLAPASTDGPDG